MGAGSRGRAGCGWHGVEARHLRLNRIEELWLNFDQLEEQRLKLIAIQASDQPLRRLPLLDLLGPFASGEEGRDDVLAPAAPIVRTGTGGSGKPCRIKRDLNAVRVDIAALYFGL